MVAVTFKFQDKQDCIVSECYIYAPTDLIGGESVKRVKVLNALWDTNSIDVKDTYLVHFGLPAGDIVTNIEATECNSDEYDAVIGMDIICKGDFAITNKNGHTTFAFRIPSQEEIVF